jgi:hypothetical protein
MNRKKLGDFLIRLPKKERTGKDCTISFVPIIHTANAEHLNNREKYPIKEFRFVGNYSQQELDLLLPTIAFSKDTLLKALILLVAYPKLGSELTGYRLSGGKYYLFIVCLGTKKSVYFTFSIVLYDSKWRYSVTPFVSVKDIRSASFYLIPQ